MQRVLLITIRFHDGRYHGSGDWPPSPARLFQALVAGVGQEGPLGDDASRPLEWLEGLNPPVIGAPHMTLGMTIPMHFVPNNDLDALGGLARNLPKTRTAYKVWKPKLFDQRAAFHYAWQFTDSPESLAHAARLCEFAERLYQLGRGVDQAWAVGEIVEPEKLEEFLLAYGGVVHRPTGGRDGNGLARPQPGSLKSLLLRYEAMRQRFEAHGQGRSIKLRFSKAPEPRFTITSYDSPPKRQVFELRSRSPQADLLAWPLSRISALAVAVRDGAVAKLKAVFPDQDTQIEKHLVGRKADGRDAAPKGARVRILPLPSIGHDHADRAIRRVLVEIPATCLLRSDDVFWAFSGLELTEALAANDTIPVLTATADDSMLAHYNFENRGYLRWRTVTPVVLPEIAKRRRIEPIRRSAETKRGSERAGEQQRAASEVVHALRHAEIHADVATIRVQREPFDMNGERAESFAQGTRFPKERLWHVEIVFSAPRSGPIVIGDGRFCGLGLMAPVRDVQSAISIDEGIQPNA